MVYIMENPIKMDDLGGTLFLGTPFWLCEIRPFWRLFDAKLVKCWQSIMKESCTFWPRQLFCGQNCSLRSQYKEIQQ